MTQDEFVSARSARWNELGALLSQWRRDRGVRTQSTTIARLAELYRLLAGDITRAERAGFSEDLVGYLSALAGRAHATLYQAPPWRWQSVIEFIAVGFPRSLRSQRGWFGFSALLFVLPFVAGWIGASVSSSFAQHIIPSEELRSMGEMYRSAHVRASGEGAMMTGFYIWNNIGIAFRCFATGVFFGLGSAFFLVYNGLIMGTVFGYVISLGYGENLLSFVATHSAFELTAIVIAGTAGLKMGYSLVKTDGETRIGSLRRKSSETISLVMGAAIMLFCAALIEGLWSASGASVWVKYTTGVISTLVVALYLGFAGRASHKAQGPLTDVRGT